MWGGGVAYGCLHEVLHGGGLGHPERRKVVLGLEREDPEVQADDHAEHGGEGGHDGAELEPGPGVGDDAREGDEEGDKDEDGVGDAGWGVVSVQTLGMGWASSSLTCQGKPLIQEVSSRLSPIFWLLEADVLDDDGEGEHEDAHEDEEKVAGYVGQSHLVCHLVFGGGGVSNGPDFPSVGVDVPPSFPSTQVVDAKELTTGVGCFFPSSNNAVVYCPGSERITGEIDLQFPAPRNKG